MEKVYKNKVLVFLDISIDGDPFERMIFELFTDVAPKTAENFRALCTGEKCVSLKTGKPLHYKGTFFHRIIKGYVAEAGDFLRKNGDYGESIYNGKFPDESPKLRHDGPGLLSMAIADRDEKGSLFTVTFKSDHRLDRKRVVFGKLVDGYEVLKKIENAGDDNGTPAVTVKIVNSGELHDYKNGENRLKGRKDATVENNHGAKRKRKHKKSSRRTRKRRRYYTSESDSSTDTDTDSSGSDTESDSNASSLSDTSSSSDGKRKRRKRSKRDKHRRGKKDRRHEKRRRKRDKKSKRKSKRDSVSDSESGSSSQDDDSKHKPSGNQSPIAERETEKVSHNEAGNMSDREMGGFPRGNGDHQNNHTGVGTDYERIADRCPDVVIDLASKSRSRSSSPIRRKSKSRSISHRSGARSPDVASKHNRSRSPHPISRSRSNTPVRNGSGKSPLRTKRAHSRHSRSRSATLSPIRRRVKRGSLSRSPVKPCTRSFSRSPIKPRRRSRSRSPISVGGRSCSRSPSVDGSPKRIRRGRGFSDRYSYVRRFRSQSRSPHHSPVRAHRYGAGRVDRDSYRRSPRRYRSPARARTPPRRRRSPSASRSPIRYRHSRSQSPVNRYRARALKSHSHSPSPPVRKANLVSYGD